MSQPTATLVFTTIFDPAVLDDYFANFAAYGRLDQVNVIVIPDRKTPSSAYERCRDLCRKGLRTACPSLEEQERYLRQTGLPPHVIPHDSDNRRNVGYLMALESGSDFLISIDDDNFCRAGEDAFAEHAVVLADAENHEVAESATGFLNICDLLEFETPAPVYPRGFPYFARHKDERRVVSQGSAPIHVNAGLWLESPDIDAMTWLVAMPRVRSFRGRSLVLGPTTWSPVNTQNTALRRAVIPSYYFIRMGSKVAGTPIDRYGDIFSGYFSQACVKRLGGAIRVGTPTALHKRNSHNYMKDTTQELACIALLEDLLPWLREAPLSGRTYIEAYESLSYLMEDAVEEFQGMMWTDLTRGYFHQMAYYLRRWLGACRNVAAN